MTKYWLNVALVRILFPTILIGCTIWRPVGLSLVYLALALVSPIVPVPTYSSMNGHTGRYLKASIGLSLIVSLVQLTFHIVLLALPPYGHFLQNCEFVETLLRHIGLVRLDSASAWEVFFWLTPEIVVFPSSIVVYLTCRRLITPPPRQEDDNSSLQIQEKKSKERSAKIINFLGSIGTYVVLATLCCAASLKPSVEGGFYFLVFIGSATWWAFHRELRRGFAFVCRVVMAVVAVHIVVLLSYQNQWPQEYLPMNSTWARYFALQAVYETNCTDPRDVEYIDDADWSTYAYSLRLFLLYFVLALQSKFLFKKPAKQRTRLSGKLETLDTPLSRHVSIRKRTPSQRWQSARRKARLMRFGSGRTGLLQDSTGSVIVQDGQQDDSIQLQSLSEGVSEEKPGVLEHVIMAVFSVFQLIVNSSYLATNIIMMTWSIMYHSWTTFALLLWALVLWMVPNKRASMMKCSPFIVFYSTLLLLVQYVYSMDLTEAELPTIIHGIKMADIGFKKPSELSCWHLVVKCLFMTMFWITMRQYTAEKMRQRRSSTLRDMVAPLHVSVSTATTAMNNQAEPEIKSKFMKDVGVVVKRFMTKFWIAVVAVMLFTSGITGERMTVFRIVYMTLFLFFIITFQISWTLWRKMMYGFWITVIGYSVIMLILVYTYQFPDFPEYWEKYLHISQNLQEDIGLITYDTKDLFVRLLTPTFFVIITVLQIHYFHHDFLEVTNIKRVAEAARKDSLGHSPSTVPIVSPTEVFASDHDDQRHVFTLKELKQMSKLERLALMRKISNHLYNFYNHIWLFLEIHMQKIIFISFVLLCIDDVCAINFFFILTIAISINFRRTAQIMVINVMATAVAVLMVIKMLYQIDYIKHDEWNRNCTEHIQGNSTTNATDIIKTYNMAEWIGMKKVTDTMKLPKLLEGYIGIITVTTFRAIIAVRQWFYRQENNESLETPMVMFPKIKRADADKGIVPCIKFLFNYGFYKFGLEFCLMGIVALIGSRLDFYSVLYSIWLMILFSMNRQTTLRVWPFLKFFAVVSLPLQYALVVAPPTWLCIDYPWRDSDILRGLQEWMFLPDPDSRPNPKKLMCDFILLLMIVRQSLVFRIEQRSASSGQEFVAGHNYSVYKDMEKPSFVNPVRDYVSHIHNWLDVFKRGSMMSLMWITLSIMFLAGTKRTNLFSLGYLIGAFVFLWQGSDFYLRPLKTILKWWNILIGYNIFVIFCKTIFQGIGCVFIQNLEAYACWCIQLLGIACLKKFEISDEQFKSSSTCDVDREDIGMVWDGLCFGFLLLQKRLFRSYYFFHIVDETKAMSILASRGAELLEELHQKRIQDQEDQEKAVLQKIKFKMDKIKANQRKIQGPSYKEPRTHKIDTLYRQLERPLYMHNSPKTHVQAIRSGDYYMFDDMDDDDLTDLQPEKDILEEENQRREREQRTRRMTISELMNTLIKTDIEIATHVALYGGTQKDAMKIRRRSVPLTRKKSSMSYLSARSDTDTAAATDLPEQASLSSAIEGDDLDEDLDKISEIDDVDASKSKEETDEPKVSFLTYFRFIWAFINSTMVSMTRYLNRYSNDYRYVRKVLAKEKKLLKAKPDFRMGTRLGISQIWQPLPIVKQRSPVNGNPDDIVDDPGEGPSTRDDRSRKSRKESSLSVPHIRILAPSLERGLDISSSSSLFSHGVVQRSEDDEAVLSEVDQPPIIQLAASVWFGILAHSTFLCYFMVFLHQIKNASILSTPLPLMVFLWGSLTIPRPSKTFWITLIAYIEVIVIIKCICQPAFLYWNKKEMSSYPFEIPRILGVERKPNYALWDLLLLLVVFFHRFMLKSLGQWTTPSLKTRKIIPSGLTVAAVRQPSADKDENKAVVAQQPTQEEEAGGTTSNVNNEITTPQGRTLSLQLEVPGDTENNSPPTGDNEKLVVIQASERSLVEEDFQKAMRLTLSKYLEPMRRFFANILDQSGKEKTNVYAYMFLCDFFNFILLIFGFSSFGAQQGDGGVATYFAENRVPMPFLLMLLLQFALIVIDRALFLKKSIAGKLIFQYCLVVGVHIWMFIILPSATERQFNTKVIPQIWYMVKCFYLLLAAYQLRLGYPTRILGNFLCKKYTIVNYTLFKGFMVVPFLFEMRAVMDWIWTDTSMTVMDWFKMEDIFANIYQIKCMRGLETDYPQERGIKKAQMSKYLVGGGALFLMIGMIWFPLLLFALGSTVGISNLPYEVTLNMKIGSYEPIYTISAQNSSIFQYSEKNFNDLRELYEVTHRDRSAVTFLENYINTDVAAVKLSTESGRLWNISPPDKNRLKAELMSDNIVTIHVEWTVSKKPASKDTSGVTSNTRDIKLEPFVNGVINPVRKDLLDALNGIGDSMEPMAGNNATDVVISGNGAGNQSDIKSKSVLLQNVLPMFLKVTSRTTSVVPQLMKPLVQFNKNKINFDAEDEESMSYLYRDVTLVVTNNSINQQWFAVHEACNDSIYNTTLNEIPLNDCSYIMMFLFNDKVFPEGLSFISGLGIFGLYTTAVILVSSFIKKMVSDMAPKIMFEDLPYVDRILRLCLDIYLVRESGDLCLEEDLFAKLVFLYRSPETLIRWTRPPEPGERTDGDDDDQNYNEIDENGGDEVDDGEESQLRRRLHDEERSE
ncbi:piezo-type mechanosensitive ion channel component isoform X3 [Nasonia vitripennis]|uniref:Piezo-type mechanosensitive ion channel component n=1 Tax=Nasonia vitripennis TaxID=7425 RepID=A0A7M7M2A5_NASVI|nr:piezo-type mechanosensitive ion channel component isoform X3 [Nasonia vitripennis]